jgi:transcription initiation factor TFIIIB Brf1 subunit/transcription initiation factor TFIIB
MISTNIKYDINPTLPSDFIDGYVDNIDIDNDTINFIKKIIKNLIKLDIASDSQTISIAASTIYLVG